jgi:hypothetical protein
MGGIFGGLLEAINMLGGGILYVLIGSNAWRVGQLARWCRLAAAAYLIGIVGGIVAYQFSAIRLLPSDLWFLMVFVQFPFYALVVIGALEGIRWILSWDQHDK